MPVETTEERSARMLAELDAAGAPRLRTRYCTACGTLYPGDNYRHQPACPGGCVVEDEQALCRRCSLPQTISADHDERCTWHPRNRRG